MLSPRTVSTALTGLFVSFALLSLPARAGCMGDWDLNGQLQFLQGDGHGWFDIEQHGTELTGRAKYIWRGSMDGKIEGTVNGSDVSITVYWDSGPVGAYRGTVSPEGWIVGETHDLMHPGTKGQWRSQGQIGCRVVETTTPPSSAPPPPPPASGTSSSAKPSTAKRRACIYTGGTWNPQTGQCEKKIATAPPPPPSDTPASTPAPAPPTEPPPASGGSPMPGTSTGDAGPTTEAQGDCGSPGAIATVIIPEPQLHTLNVRAAPGGAILGTVPEDSQVTVMGQCTSDAAGLRTSDSSGRAHRRRGLTAECNVDRSRPDCTIHFPGPHGGEGSPGGVSGWCQIVAPIKGCVMARYLSFSGAEGAADAAGFARKRR
jgi:hypothetical protein